ncbi:P-loop containing nucleoside triphosphate hydrolase protein [Gyrodon lividus]|nr:P-loop containing nucleoside triphosphate hydrolase protein [Gyrodon lividus]
MLLIPNLCPEVQEHGICKTSGCSKHHDVRVCDICSIVCSSSKQYAAHLAGKRHRRCEVGASVTLHCTACNTYLSGSKAWDIHSRSKKHARLSGARVSQGISVVVKPSVSDEIPGQVYCAICTRFVTKHQWSFHQTSSQHRIHEGFVVLKNALDEARKDKHGISVSGDLDFGIVDHTSAIVGILGGLVITTTIPSSSVSIVSATLSSPASTSPVHAPFSVISLIQGLPLTCGHPTKVVIGFCTPRSGRAEDRLEILFEDRSLGQHFVVVRNLYGIVGNVVDCDPLKVKAPLNLQPRTSSKEEIDVIPGVSSPALRVIPYVVKLPPVTAPPSLVAVLSESSTVKGMTEQLRRIFLPKTFDASTYARHFKTLIWVEEFHSERDLEQYDVLDARLTNHKQYYYLEVPGLAERRPRILVGDRILVHKHGAPKGQWYEGCVHVVRKVDVGLRFHNSFKGWTPDQRYHIRFKLNRIPVQRQHQALDTAFSPERIFFPTRAHIKAVDRDGYVGIQPCNPLITNNQAQLLAVTSILRLPRGSPPFVLYGPPATGKTITIVEAMKQILTHKPCTRILAIAPSNSAADLIALRLISFLRPHELFRLYAPSRREDQVPHELLPYTCKRDGHFTPPPVRTFEQFRVVVCSCVSASIPYGIGVPRGHFDYIFVDEAGQATEPEVMIGIRSMSNNETNVVLSGDPLQLRPVIRSGVVRELGLEKSFLERLIALDAYDPMACHGKTIVKLVRNFRSHPAILAFPNERFYGQELQACGDVNSTHAYVGYPKLPSKKFPIIFHAVSGRDELDASSLSFFNIDEATKVKEYIQQLQSERKYRIADRDIGVITPYHAQCLKIRAVLGGVADGAKVGTVEEFQGQERRIIIISTVRSSKNFVDYDLRHTLGFVASPRRLNVAITRAQALLIVIGDPHILSLDPLWRSFLNYIYQNGGWVGSEPTWAADALADETESRVETAIADMDALSQRIKILLSEVGGSEEGTLCSVEEAHGNPDRPWRELE